MSVDPTADLAAFEDDYVVVTLLDRPDPVCPIPGFTETLEMGQRRVYARITPLACTADFVDGDYWVIVRGRLPNEKALRSFVRALVIADRE